MHKVTRLNLGCTPGKYFTINMVCDVTYGMVGHVARMDGRKDVYRILMGRPERSRPLVKPRRRWDDNIKMDLQSVGWRT